MITNVSRRRVTTHDERFGVRVRSFVADNTMQYSVCVQAREFSEKFMLVGWSVVDRVYAGGEIATAVEPTFLNEVAMPVTASEFQMAHEAARLWVALRESFNTVLPPDEAES
jgi:hypothetical protein